MASFRGRRHWWVFGRAGAERLAGPAADTFRGPVVGQVSQTGVPCVTGMLPGARLVAVWHHARAHRFFSNARCSTDELGLPVTERLVNLIAGALPGR